jgi:hypothetical protein
MRQNLAADGNAMADPCRLPEMPAIQGRLMAHFAPAAK